MYCLNVLLSRRRFLPAPFRCPPWKIKPFLCTSRRAALFAAASAPSPARALASPCCMILPATFFSCTLPLASDHLEFHLLSDCQFHKVPVS